MCGVSVIISPGPETPQAAISRMVSVMTHRGPDGAGTYVDEIDGTSFLALGHNRLSIIDLSDHAAQPMKSRDGRYVLVYNGEVYNYREIARQLDKGDLPDAECGDTAVILAALIKWGPRALAMFNGMWALVLYDAQDKTLLVSRDRFGVKPLYSYRDGEQVFFASEIKAILTATGLKYSLNADVVVPYLTRGLLNFSDNTFFERIEQFPAASYQIIDLRAGLHRWPKTERFWCHPFEAGERPAIGRVSPEEIRAVFLDAVRLRLRSDVPVGVLLSGGVDSSSIVGGIVSDEGVGLGVGVDNLTVLAVTSDDPSANEEPFIDLMARYAHVQPQKVNVSNDPMALLDRVSDACWSNDEPLCGIADVAHRRLMELARCRGIKVLLSGQGADEQLGGYNKFFYFWMLNLLQDRRYLDLVNTGLRFARHSNTLHEFRLSEAVRYLGRARLASSTFIAPAHQQRDGTDIGFQGSYARREWLDLAKTSLPALLHYEDRMSMSQSVEVRVPFLDFRLVECLARVDPSEKFEGGWTKSIFRKAITGLVPTQIQYRRDKKGFNVPEDDWMRAAFRPSVSETFGSGMMAESLGFLDSQKLGALYSRFVNGHGYLNGRHFFRVYAFEMFLRRFAAHIDG
jgi:asparagine synthase (glutamine-hydrolysing)